MFLAHAVWIPACAGMTRYGSFDLELEFVIGAGAAAAPAPPNGPRGVNRATFCCICIKHDD